MANWPPYALGLLKSIVGTHWPRRTTRIRLIGGLMGENVRFVISLGFGSRSFATPAQASRASHRWPSSPFTPARLLLSRAQATLAKGTWKRPKFCRTVYCISVQACPNAAPQATSHLPHPCHLGPQKCLTYPPAMGRDASRSVTRYDGLPLIPGLGLLSGI